MYELFLKLLSIRGVSVADVSRMTGINQSVFSNWKARGNYISAENGIKIADLFNVSLDYLYGRKEIKYATPYATFSDEEYALVEAFRKMTPDQRILIRNLIPNKKGESYHSEKAV